MEIASAAAGAGRGPTRGGERGRTGAEGARGSSRAQAARADHAACRSGTTPPRTPFTRLLGAGEPAGCQATRVVARPDRAPLLPLTACSRHLVGRWTTSPGSTPKFATDPERSGHEVGTGRRRPPAPPSRMSNRGRGSGRQVVARHRSPRGRRTLQDLPPPVHRRAATGDGVRRAATFPVPARRGVAVAVAGGVLTLGGAAVFDRSVDSSPLDPSAAEASLNVDTTGDGSAVALATDPQRVARSSPPPVLAADPPALDVAALTTAVRRAGEEAAAQRRAADERRADGPGDEAEEERRAEPEDPASAERTSTGRAERSTRSSPAPAGGCGLSTKGLG